jgi:hypothetical protein
MRLQVFLWAQVLRVLCFLVGSILKRCDKFIFHLSVECVVSNQISSFLSLHLSLTIQFFSTWIYLFFQLHSDSILCIWGHPQMMSR